MAPTHFIGREVEMILHRPPIRQRILRQQYLLHVHRTPPIAATSACRTWGPADYSPELFEHLEGGGATITSSVTTKA